MIENNLVHFIASDAHHETQRPFIMESLYKDRKLKKYEKSIKILLITLIISLKRGYKQETANAILQ